MNERADQIEEAANSVIKNNKKFWLGFLVGVGVMIVINAAFFIGKLLG